MKIYLTADRKQSIKNDCHMMLGTRHLEIRDVAMVLGKITTSFPGVMMGPLHYRCLDMNKTTIVSQNLMARIAGCCGHRPAR